MEVIVHCSDTPNGRPHNAADIHRWHKEKGWDGIGYHHVIQLDGTVENGRPHYWPGAHCKGQNSKVGICLIGRDQFTPLQEKALAKLLLKLKALTVKGHYQYDSGKTCPGFDVEAWWNNQITWPTLESK